MARILTISGSPEPSSRNSLLLKKLEALTDSEVLHAEGLEDLPIFQPYRDQKANDEVTIFRHAVKSADAVIICTPEYIHNIPAVLKNALEWLTTSGELYEKPTIALTFTPQEPRGEFAMHALLQSLKALNAKVLLKEHLFQSDFTFENNKITCSDDSQQFLEAILQVIPS